MTGNVPAQVITWKCTQRLQKYKKYNIRPVREQVRDQMALKVPQQVAQTQARGAPPWNSQPRQTIVRSLDQQRLDKSERKSLTWEGWTNLLSSVHHPVVPPAPGTIRDTCCCCCLLAQCPIEHPPPVFPLFACLPYSQRWLSEWPAPNYSVERI